MMAGSPRSGAADAVPMFTPNRASLWFWGYFLFTLNLLKGARDFMLASRAF